MRLFPFFGGCERGCLILRSFERHTLDQESVGMILRANGCTDNPSGHSEREQYLALPARHPIHRCRYICAGAEIHVSYVSTLIVLRAL